MKNVVIVGVGALGSHLVLLMRNVPATIRVVDFDRVEKKNTLSQFHTTMVVGKNKAEAIKQAMSGLFGLKIEASPFRLTDSNVAVLLGKADLVVDCLDNGESRRVIQKFVRDNAIPCIHAAVDAAGTYGRVVWDANFVIDDEAKPGQPTCEGGENLPFLGAVSAQLALSVRRFVKDGGRIGAEINPAGVIGT